MPDLYPYSEESLSEMFSLTGTEISAIIKNEGVPVFSNERKRFNGYLPSLNSVFQLTFRTDKQVRANVKKESYRINLRSGLVCLETYTPKLPATSFLSHIDWADEINNVLPIDETTTLLIPQKIGTPVYCGPKRLIARLANNFTGDILVVNMNTFINEWR